MGFLDKIFKPVSSVFNGVVVHPLDNITSGIGSGFAGIGQGFAGIGQGLGTGIAGVGQGVGGGINSLGSGVSSLISSPILLIAVGIGGILLLKSL